MGKKKRQHTRLDFFRSLCDWDFLDRSWSASSSSEYSSSLYRLFLCFLLRSFSLLFSFDSWISEASAFSVSTPSFLKCSSFSLSPFLCFSFLLSLSSLSFSFLAYQFGEKNITKVELNDNPYRFAETLVFMDDFKLIRKKFKQARPPILTN